MVIFTCKMSSKLKLVFPFLCLMDVLVLQYPLEECKVQFLT